jgi:hypothetical protein
MTLFESIHATLRRLRYSPRTEEAYVHRSRELIRFHDGRHPRDLSPANVTAFLKHLAVRRRCSGSTQDQACCAKDVRTTVIYTHVVDRGPLGVVRPLDR